VELEFDKEIDALLRKAQPPAAPTRGAHMDADAMNAFAEGAMPEAIRKTYTAHLSDCDSCRKALSQVALLNEPIAMTAVAATAAAPFAAPIPARRSVVPWYRSLFSTPGLAAAFGVLVLAFGGVLAYLITQRGAATDTSVAMQKEVSNSAASAPYAGIESNAGMNANASSATSNRSTTNKTAHTAAASSTNSTTKTTVDQPVGSASNAVASNTMASGTAPSQPPVAAAPASKPADALVAGGSVAAEKSKDEAKTEQDRREDKEAIRNRALSEDSPARGTMTAKKVAGPGRSAGQVQNQVQANAQSEMAVTRKVAGKTFHSSSGAWYDSAYHGQSTTNIRRGSDEFKKLDSGLRSIANELGGVVVVVWKDKAYRIQ
jgi:hypothetical protein